jgi:hypothetical protein
MLLLYYNLKERTRSSVNSPPESGSPLHAQATSPQSVRLGLSHIAIQSTPSLTVGHTTVPHPPRAGLFIVDWTEPDETARRC